jgi:hypothetical protein
VAAQHPAVAVPPPHWLPMATGRRSGVQSECRGSLHRSFLSLTPCRANAYYFWNSKTNETTWTNPVATTAGTASPAAATAPPSTSSTSTPLSSSTPATGGGAPPSQPDLGGIDPDLAYLDPSLSASSSSRAGGGPPAFQARFNARTGRFEGSQGRTPEHVSDYNRSRRQNEFFFDVSSWERQVEEEQNRKRAAEELGEENKKKRLSKAQVVRVSLSSRLGLPDFFPLTPRDGSKHSRRRKPRRKPQSSAHGFSNETFPYMREHVPVYGIQQSFFSRFQNTDRIMYAQCEWSWGSRVKGKVPGTKKGNRKRERGVCRTTRTATKPSSPRDWRAYLSSAHSAKEEK